MKRAVRRVIDGLQDHQGAIDPGVVELLAELVKLAAAVIPGLIRRGKLEDAIEEAARELPMQWQISIDVSSGYVGVELDYLAGVEYAPYEAEGTLAEQVKALVELAKKGGITDSAVRPPC